MSGLEPLPSGGHVGRNITIPYSALYRAMRGFLSDLERAEAKYRGEIAAIRTKLGVDAVYVETPEVERYSSAVQLFAAMTVDALISFYAVLRFGGAHHDDQFRWPRVDKRLRKALDTIGVQLADDAEILVLIRDLKDARDRIAHPHSYELLGSEQAAIQLPHRPGPDDSASAARRAVAAVDRIFALIRELDPDHAHFLTTV